MLVTPAGDVVAHRIGRQGGCGEPRSRRLAAARENTVVLGGPPATVARPATSRLREVAEEVRALRPAADAAIDQWHLDTTSLCRRISALLASRPMDRSRIAFIGDDDLALTALLRLTAPMSTLLVEIDPRIVAVTQAEARREGAGRDLEVHRIDLSATEDVARLHSLYGETFDVVVTDPPHAPSGLARFLDVAMALTAHTGEVHIAVPALLAEAWTDDLLHDVQATLLGSGFVIDRVEPGAFSYEETDVVASLVVARRLPGAPHVEVREVPDVRRFYTTGVVPAQAPVFTAGS